MDMTRKNKTAKRTETTQSSSSSSHHLPCQKRTKLHHDDDHHGSHQQVEIIEPISMENDGGSQLQASADPFPFARSYQIEALEMALRENTIVFLETGTGKTLIAIMLLQRYAYLLRKPSQYIAVFLVPKVVLVEQQGDAVEMHTDLKVGKYWGEMGIDRWDAAIWKQQIENHEVLVMTPAILLNSMMHGFLKLDMIKVLIMDECHHARGKDAYASIMSEFYHRQLKSGSPDLPRIFGMTASPIKSKVGNSKAKLSKDIRKLMTLMHSKVYTCKSEADIAKYISTPTPKFKFYEQNGISSELFQELQAKLEQLKQKHEESLKNSDFTTSVVESAQKRITKNFNALKFCLGDLGVWLTLKGAEFMSSCNERESYSLSNSAVGIVKDFCLAVLQTLSNYIPSDLQWSIGNNMQSDMDKGILTSKVCCLMDTLLEYRDLTDIRCIIFVKRAITAVVLMHLLNVLLPNVNSWNTKYMAGNHHKLQNQTRKNQNEIVEEFRKGLVNIIVATSILEEGLDVQSCNLVIRFDPCPTVCSFIQSRGRARMQNSDYVLMVQREDSTTRSRLEEYHASGDIMRKESLRQSSLPCDPFESDQFSDKAYCVESTGAFVSLRSSIGLLHFFCSRLPADGYFKPTPRWIKETGTLHLPKSSPLQTICVEGDKRILKNLACLEACKQLHRLGALTDNLVPNIVVEAAEAEEFGCEPYNEKQPSYIPYELVNRFSKTGETVYHCYLMELNPNFCSDKNISNIILAMRTEIDPEIGCMQFDMCFDKGSLHINMRYAGSMNLSPYLVLLCKRFQVSILRVLLDHDMNKLATIVDKLHLEDNLEIDYLLLPTLPNNTVDWTSISSATQSQLACQNHALNIRTKTGLVCPCILRNSLVYTTHNKQMYITTGIMEEDGNSCLTMRDGEVTTYKKYYKQNHGIQLQYESQKLLQARHIFRVKNYCHWRRPSKKSVASKISVELPPELCYIVMSPISISTIYTFSFVPSIMHRIESLLVASNLKKMHSDHYTQNKIQISKLLEAVTTKRCKESFHYESLETLGDSFLKYAASQQLFTTYQDHHEGLLSIKRQKIISNAALCKLGCSCKIVGFIRDDPFEPTTWVVPGDNSQSLKLEQLNSKETNIFVRGYRTLKRKTVADVVEAQIGAYLSTGGEKAALQFMDWVGIKVNFNSISYDRKFSIHPERLVNISFLESLLKYSFHDKSLLVEALTHGSYMLPEIPRCYQRLEFLGDSVLDYLITEHLYKEYLGLSPGQLTDIRAASVNNDCYAWSAIKANLHKHVLYTSQELHKHIVVTLNSLENLSSESLIGWGVETSFPKVLGDIIESLAGAILVDSGYNKETVWLSIRPLLEPLTTPETLQLHPTRELTELCQKKNYVIEKTLSRRDGVTSFKMVVHANGVPHHYEYEGCADKKTAKKIASKEILKKLQETEPS